MHSIARSVMFAGVALSALVSCRAESGVLWVDDDNFGKTGLTGESKELAFGSIQDAIDAAGAGYTIRVMPGVYTNGCGNALIEKITPARVVVLSKENLTIVSEEGPEKTVIRGSLATDATDYRSAVGEGAIGCVLVRKVSAFRLEGFTLENGSTLTHNDGRTSYGGAFHGYDAESSGIYMVDCVVRNCYAGWGVLYGVTAIRCLIDGNHAGYAPTTVWGDSGVFRATKLYSCVAVRNYSYDQIGIDSVAVNSTFVNNLSVRRFSRKTTSVYNCVILSSGSVSDATTITVTNCVTGGYPIMSTATDDWRPIAGGTAVSAGSSDHLGVITVPEDCAGKDFYGNPLVSDSGTVPAGAVATPASVAGGGIHWANRYVIDGVTCGSSHTYAFPAAYPTQWNARVVLDSGKYLTRYRYGDEYLPPQMDDSIWVMPPPSPDNVVTMTYNQAETAVWVDPDPEKGSDTEGDGTEAKPYFTLQKAVSSIDGGVVYAKAGTYAAGGDMLQGCSNRVTFSGKQIRLIGVEGASKTFIKGESDPDTLSSTSIPGCGAGAMRCVGVGDGGGSLQGFTLIGGRTQTSSSGGIAESRRGGAVWWGGGNSARFWLTDCVVSNCIGEIWGVVRGAYVMRCRFTGCRAKSSLFSDSLGCLAFCEFDSSCKSEDGDKGIINREAYHVSIAGSPTQNPFEDNPKVKAACVVGSGKSVPESAKLSGCVLGNTGSVLAGSGYVEANPYFAYPDTGDLRVLDISPVLTAGEKPTASNYGATYYLRSSSDIDGNRIVFTPDGKPMAGARMSTLRGIYVDDVNEALSVAGGGHGSNFMTGEEDSLEITMAAGSTRPCIGFTVNGVTNLFDEMQGAYALTAGDTANGSVAVSAIYTADWYADAVNGSDDNTGYTPKTAKSSLRAALALASAGDTVHAAPGTYSDGKEHDDLSADTYSRAVVPAGVTLVADKGPDVTIIEGEAPPEGDTYGLGAGAVRCVSLLRNSTVRGFTLRNGYTASVDGYNGRGGGVLGVYNGDAAYASMKVENCVISNCTAYNGAGCFRVTAIKCRMNGNKGTSNNGGAVTHNSALYGCRVYGNFGRSIVYGAYMVNGCTLGPDRNLNDTDRAVYEVSTPNVADVLYNTLVYGHVLDHDKLNAYRCIVTGEIPADQLQDGSLNISAGSLALDEGGLGMPVIGANAAVDAANPGYYDAEIAGDTDLLGGQRVYNGAMDIGAVEADWRGEYGRVLGSRVTVTAADPDVVLVAGEGVSVTNGSISLVLSGRASGGTSCCSFRAAVSGSGTLEIYRDGSLFGTMDSSDGTKEISFASAAELNSLKFAYLPGEDDGGGALLSAFRCYNGFRFMVR